MNPSETQSATLLRHPGKPMGNPSSRTLSRTPTRNSIIGDPVRNPVRKPNREPYRCPCCQQPYQEPCPEPHRNSIDESRTPHRKPIVNPIVTNQEPCWEQGDPSSGRLLGSFTMAEGSCCKMKKYKKDQKGGSFGDLLLEELKPPTFYSGLRGTLCCAMHPRRLMALQRFDQSFLLDMF